MGNRNILAIFVGVSLVLFFASQVLAQTSTIEGWDKAKFGMSVEELKDAYRKEAQFFRKWRGKDFWEEDTSREDEFIGVIWLVTPGLELSFKEIGYLNNVRFGFIDNKLWTVGVDIDRVEKNKKQKLISFLSQKYGDPLQKISDIEWYWWGWNGEIAKLTVEVVPGLPEKGGILCTFDL